MYEWDSQHSKGNYNFVGEVWDVFFNDGTKNWHLWAAVKLFLNCAKLILNIMGFWSLYQYIEENDLQSDRLAQGILGRLIPKWVWPIK